ncbi:MAG: phosphoribosyltransferase family protein [Patescibacteria group bacterium]|jgi:orotate phosphoribosyltransferase
MVRVRISEQFPIIPDDPFAILCACGAFYSCPRGPDGKRIGKMVVYAGTYDVLAGGRNHYIGDDYANIGVVEELPHVLADFARLVADQIVAAGLDFTTVLGAPMGGIQFSQVLGAKLDCRVIYAEKMVIEVGTETSRGKSVPILDRHKVNEGDRVIIVEDICNNFSTTKALVELVLMAGGKVVGVACVLNRSPYKTEWQGDQGRTVLPVFSGVYREMPQYKQEDPAVAAYVAAGNVEFHVKAKWGKLMESMKAAQT